MKKDRQFLQALDSQVVGYESDLSRLYEQQRALESEIAEVRDCLERAKALREAEARRVGDGDFRFVTMAIREACHTLLREKGKMTKAQLLHALKKGSFSFGKRSPGRTVHFALVGNPRVKKNNDGTFEYIESPVKKVLGEGS